MGPPRALGGSETDPSHYIKAPLGFVAFHPAPGLEIFCYARRSLVLSLESTRTNLAPDHEDLQTVERHMISRPKTMLTVVWIPHGFHLVNTLPKRQK
jgi:hypothetical protein